MHVSGQERWNPSLPPSQGKVARKIRGNSTLGKIQNVCHVLQQDSTSGLTCSRIKPRHLQVKALRWTLTSHAPKRPPPVPTLDIWQIQWLAVSQSSHLQYGAKRLVVAGSKRRSLPGALRSLQACLGPSCAAAHLSSGARPLGWPESAAAPPSQQLQEGGAGRAVSLQGAAGAEAAPERE